MANKFKKYLPTVAKIITKTYQWINDTGEGKRRPISNHYVENTFTKYQVSLTRKELVNACRNLVEQSGWVDGTLNLISRYSVGNGLHPQANTSNEKFNIEAETYWKKWKQHCDSTGRFDLDTILKMICRAIDRDGDIGIRLVKNDNGKPLIQLIECNQIDSWRDDNFNDGVKINKYGRPEAYRIVNLDGTYEDISSDDFILVMEPKRPNQYRGIPTLSSAVATATDLSEIIQAEIQGVKIATSLALVHKTSTGETIGSDLLVGDDEGNQKVIKRLNLYSGDIVTIPSTDDISGIQSEKPTTGLQDFEKMLVRSICLSLDLPYELCYDPTSAGGASIRLIVSQGNRKIKERQQTLIKVLNRLYRWVIASAIKNNELPMSSEYFSVNWQCPSELTVDYGREAAANLNDLRAGLRTYMEDYSERGYDWREQIEQKAIEASYISQMAKKYNIDREAIASVTPNPPSISSDYPISVHPDTGNIET